MKRIIGVLLILGMIIIYPAGVLGVPMEFSGGVNNEYEYCEYVFLSGEPVKFIGTYKVTQSGNQDKETINYRFTLTSENKELQGKLDRQMTYVTTYKNINDKGQTIAQTDLGKMREVIDIMGVRYELRDYQFSKSDIIDNRPVSDFYNGNIKGRKHYTINRNQGTVTVDISGGDIGYENFWGSTDTQIIDYVINVDRQYSGTDEEEQLKWQGTVRAQVSDSMTKTLKYEPNEVNYSSIEGGHVKIINREMVSVYDYNLPKIVNGIPDSKARKNGEEYLSQKMLPRIERLIVPKFRDVGGHWAEDEIKKLYSLDVFDDNAQFFMPDVPMTRVEFTKAVMRACDIRPSDEKGKSQTARRSKVKEVSPFKDVDVDDADYQYIKSAVEKGIIFGAAKDMFKPKDPLTRAEAAVILVRALGFENRAPNPGYKTNFDDDMHIPTWAKDGIYVAREIGLLKGDNRNNVNAGKQLTRAEASALLSNFLDFLQRDLQRDYRENIILYN